MGHTVLLTGASSGIGLALAKLFARDGYDLVMVSQNEDNLKKAVREISNSYKGIKASAIAVDLAGEGGADEIFRILSEKNIKPDILVNNAGVQIYGSFYKVPLENIMRLLYLNMNALVKLTGLFLPVMIERGYGRVLNLASIASFQPGPLNAAYCASKAFVLSFSEGIAYELKGTGVTVTALCPGATATNFAERGNIKNTRFFKGRVWQADKVAAAGYKALMKGKTSSVVGIGNRLLIFTNRLVPRSAVLKICGYMMEEI
jgi:short-subunit dehydrogenase